MLIVLRSTKQDDDKVKFLDCLLQNEMTFREVERRSTDIKSMQVAKDVLLKKVECDSWEEAAEALPQYCNEQALSQFKVVKGKVLSDDFKVHETSRTFQLLSV